MSSEETPMVNLKINDREVSVPLDGARRPVQIFDQCLSLV